MLHTQKVSWSDASKACLNGAIFREEFTRISRGRISLYHGTRAPLEKILGEGLLIYGGHRNKMSLVREALADLGLKIRDVPRWVWESSIHYEANIEPHIHCSLNIGTAAAYAWQGCETKAVVRAGALIWLLSRLLGHDVTFRELEELGVSDWDIRRVAAEANGLESHVIKVEVPIEYVRREDYEDVLRMIHLYGEQRLLYNIMEVRVVRNIPPDMIKAAWRVVWRGRSLYDGYDLKPVMVNML